ncbi:hypothetical protein EAS54_06945 [Bradyrhizobium guangzhouense]|nr:hypothetical protein EAS54_06945 [Bradyrhizobium guangzhouense]
MFSHASTPSLRAKRSNPESLHGNSLDCFVARAPRNDGVCGNGVASLACIIFADIPSHPRGSSRPSFASSLHPPMKEGAGKTGCQAGTWVPLCDT